MFGNPDHNKVNDDLQPELDTGNKLNYYVKHIAALPVSPVQAKDNTVSLLTSFYP